MSGEYRYSNQSYKEILYLIKCLPPIQIQQQDYMKFIVSFLLKITFLLLVATIGYEVVHENYTQFIVNKVQRTKENLLKVNKSVLDILLQHILKLQWNSFTVLAKVYEIYLNNFFYIVLFIIIIIFYYELKLKSLEYPNIQTRVSMSPKKYEHEKQEQTKNKVEQLVNSKQYQQYLAQKQSFINRQQQNEQDEVLKQIEQKQQEIFDS